MVNFKGKGNDDKGSNIGRDFKRIGQYRASDDNDTSAARAMVTKNAGQARYDDCVGDNDDDNGDDVGDNGNDDDDDGDDTRAVRAMVTQVAGRAHSGQISSWEKSIIVTIIFMAVATIIVIIFFAIVVMSMISRPVHSTNGVQPNPVGVIM